MKSISFEVVIIYELLLDIELIIALSAYSLL